MNNQDFQAIFTSLKEVLKKYENKLVITSNKKTAYNLFAGYDKQRKADIYFGGVVINKKYVSYHLMPVYVNPRLLDEVSPELRNRMQGKSCFNFNKIDNDQLKEVKTITKKCFEFYKQKGMLPDKSPKINNQIGYNCKFRCGSSIIFSNNS